MRRPNSAVGSFKYNRQVPLYRRSIPLPFFQTRLPSRMPGVLLTFDDGPHPETTPQVLERLRDHGARAVFFVVGHRIPRAPHLLARIIEEGHVLGNHSFAHPLDRQPWLFDYLADLRRCQSEIERLAGYTPTLHRPPLGTTSLASALAPRLLGMTSMLWSVSSEDWRFQSAEEARSKTRELLSVVEQRDILLYHDEVPFVVDSLDLLLPELTRRGIPLDPLR